MSDKDLFAPPTPDEIKSAKASPDLFAPPSPEELKAVKAEPGFGQKAVDGTLAFFSGDGGSIGDNIPIIGPLARKAGEGFRAGTEYLGRKAFGTEKPFGEILSGIESENDARQAKFAKEHPYANVGRQIAGALGSAMIPIPGANAGGIIGAGTRIAGTAAISGADTALRTKSLDEAKNSATFGGLAQTAMESIPVVGKAVGPLARPFGQGIEKLGAGIAESGAGRAVKAAFGNNGKLYKNLGDIPGAGNLALDKGVVSFGSKAGAISRKAGEASKAEWSKVDEVFRAADDAGVKIDSKRVADEILVAAQKIDPIGKSRSIADNLVKEAADIQKLGSISLSKAQELKNRFKFEMKDPLTHALGDDGNNIINRAFGNAIKDTVETSGLPGAEGFVKAYQGSGVLGSLARGAKDTSDKLTKNRSPFSMTDLILGVGAGNAGAILTGDVGDSSVAGLAVAAANSLARNRGNAALAASLRNLGQSLAAKPQQFSKFYGVLEAAAKEGQASLAATHALLLQKEPEYKKLLTPPAPSGMPLAPDNAIQRRIQRTGE